MISSAFHEPGGAALSKPAQGADSQKNRYLVYLSVIALLLVHYLLALTSIHGKSNTYDELCHLSALEDDE